MKPYITKYSNLCKILLVLFLTLGCNLSMEGHFWPDNMFPYVFLILCLSIVYRTDWREVSEWLGQKKIRIYVAVLLIICILMQGIILRFYLVDSVIVFIKAGIKLLIAGVSIAGILTLALFETKRRKKNIGIPFVVLCLVEIIYFYFVRQITESFSICPLLIPVLLYLQAGTAVGIRSEVMTDSAGSMSVDAADGAGIRSEVMTDSAGSMSVDAADGAGLRSAHRTDILLKAGAVVLALCETLGYMALSYWNYHGTLLKWLALAFIGTVVWSFIFYYVVDALFMMLDGIAGDGSGKNTSRKTFALHHALPEGAGGAAGLAVEKAAGLSACKTAALFLVIAAIRCLYWLNWFPALLSKDTYVQIQQALGNEAYSNHHPWLHTMIIKLFMNVGKLIFGSNQAGVACTALASVLCSSFLLLLVLKYYYNEVPAKTWTVAAVIFAIEPIHCVYSITIWKDVLFAYALLAFCFMLMIMEKELKQEGRLKPYVWGLYIIVSFVFCFSRTNGLYAWIFTLPFLLWHYRKQLRPWLASTAVCLVLIIGYKGWLLPHFQVTEPDTVEALSVPLQQVAFAIQNGGEFSEYDINVINSIGDMDGIGEHYNAHISDPVKNYIRNTGSQEYITQNKLEFLKMYISVGIKNPTDYIVAFLNQSRGYWYQKMSNYIYFSEGVHRFAAEIDIYRTPLIPSGLSMMADKLMNKYCDVWHAFWSLALSTYTVWLLFIYLLAKKKTCFYFLPVIGVFITLVIATPVNDEFRYAYGIYLALPLLFMQTVTREKGE